MGKKVKWSWTSALVGAASAAAVAGIITCKPKKPDFHVVSLRLTSFNLNPPALDADLILTVHVTNPNVVPVRYSSAEMSISYSGSPLGSARMDAGSQRARSCQILRLPARLSCVKLAQQHGGQFVADVGRREMVLDAAVDVEGTARVMRWEYKFRVHVESNVVVDPVLLDVIDQDSKSEMEVFVS